MTEKERKEWSFYDNKNDDKIAEINHLIPPNVNMFGVSADQNEKVLKKIYGLQLRKMRLMRGYTQTRGLEQLSNISTTKIRKRKMLYSK